MRGRGWLAGCGYLSRLPGKTQAETSGFETPRLPRTARQYLQMRRLLPWLWAFIGIYKSALYRSGSPWGYHYWPNQSANTPRGLIIHNSPSCSPLPPTPSPLLIPHSPQTHPQTMPL